MKKNIIVIIIIIIVIASLAFLWKSQQSTSKESKPTFEVPQTPAATISSTDKPQIVSAKPDPLEDNIISTTEIVEITFNRSLENVGEFKVRIEPRVDFKVELSNDRKTARIIPTKSYELGTTYTLFIGTETKFDGVGRWGEEKIFHFRTIRYTGV